MKAPAMSLWKKEVEFKICGSHGELECDVHPQTDGLRIFRRRSELPRLENLQGRLGLSRPIRALKRLGFLNFTAVFDNQFCLQFPRIIRPQLRKWRHLGLRRAGVCAVRSKRWGGWSDFLSREKSVEASHPNEQGKKAAIHVPVSLNDLPPVADVGLTGLSASASPASPGSSPSRCRNRIR